MKKYSRGMGWWGESQRHRLARFGVKTKQSPFLLSVEERAVNAGDKLVDRLARENAYGVTMEIASPTTGVPFIDYSERACLLRYVSDRMPEIARVAGYKIVSSGFKNGVMSVELKKNPNFAKSEGYRKDNVTIIGFVARRDNDKPSALIMSKYDRHKRAYVYKGKFTGIKDSDKLIKKLHGVERRYRFTGLPLREGGRDVILAPKLKLMVRHGVSPYGIYTDPAIVRK